mmetsp:Transcript_53402/g.117075  ORF Transcript_53402/g.117075 Transcript_53402/m.117075 type:complete len:239 (-) Transcript_53402:42-758(-)
MPDAHKKTISDEKKKLTESSCFPTGHLSLSSDVSARVFFSTSSRCATPDWSVSNWSNAVRAKHDGVQYRFVRSPEAWKPKEASLLLGKESSNYNRDFITLSLDGAKSDRDMSRMFLASDREGSQKSGGKALSMQTTNQQFFMPPTADGRGRSCAPSKGDKVHTPTKSLETKSLSMAEFRNHDPGMSRQMRGELATSHDSEHTQTVIAFIHKSEHSKEFHKKFKRKSQYPKTGNPAWEL